ncbi:MAG: hypothetical protein U9R23_04605 [Candidatus Cloacimonadota bacterium]|nr:hypothetical protein [Candidatus Cloacimonadota bacterium]
MKKFLITLFIIALITTPIFAKTNNQNKENSNLNTNEKVDSIYVLQQKIYKTVKNQPLADKKYGIEFNIFRLIFFGSDTNLLNHTLSGGFSIFNIDRQAEIAFPIFYSNPENKWGIEWYDEINYLRQFTLDCHYRRFLGHSQNGFYISGFVRYANIRGYEYYYWGDGKDDDSVNSKMSSENKLGIGIGIGYRIFSCKGFYWGTSLNLGRYFFGENDRYIGQFLWYDNDNEVIFNFELLKFGWAF